SRLSRLSIDEARLRDFDAPASAEVVYEVVRHFTGEPEREGSVSDSKVWAKLLSVNLDYDRSEALDLWAPFDSRHRWVFRLPPSYRLDGVPRQHEVRSKWGTFTLTVRDGGPHEVEVEMHTRLEQERVEPADFDDFRRFHEEVSRFYRVWLNLVPTHN